MQTRDIKRDAHRALYKELRRCKISQSNAERRGDPAALANLKKKQELIQYLIDLVMKEV